MLDPERRRRRRRRLLILLAVVAVLAGMTLGSTGCLATLGSPPDPARLELLAKRSRMEQGRFVNLQPQTDLRPSLGVMLEFLTGGHERSPRAPLPLEDPVPAWATPPPTGLRVTWFGHSSALIELDGFRVLTDPVWGERASPSSLVGPERFHPPPASIDSLPPLDAVVISHDHYDHLDMTAVEALAKREVRFYVPLGIGSHLRRWGVPLERIVELDWWEEVVVPGRPDRAGAGQAAPANFKLAATPARHFSGRSLTDRNATLWASWVIASPSRRVYFSGDTGPMPQFQDIRDTYGPFELVMLEIGAYHPSWGDIHLGPDGAAKAWETLGGGPLLPIHWSTFSLGLHDWYQPADRLLEVARERNIPLLTPEIGQAIDIPPRQKLEAWWKR